MTAVHPPAGNRKVLPDALAGWLVDRVFALMGSANQALMCDLADHLGLRLVRGRHKSEW